MWHSRTWLIGGIGGAGLRVGFSDFRGLFQTKQFSDSVILLLRLFSFKMQTLFSIFVKNWNKVSYWKIFFLKAFIKNIPVLSKLSYVLFFLKNVYKKREKTLKICLLDVDGQLLLTLQLLFFSQFITLENILSCLRAKPRCVRTVSGSWLSRITSEDNTGVTIALSGKIQRIPFTSSHLPLKASHFPLFVAGIFDTTSFWKLQPKVSVVKQYVSLLCAPGQ